MTDTESAPEPTTDVPVRARSWDRHVERVALEMRELADWLDGRRGAVDSLSSEDAPHLTLTLQMVNRMNRLNGDAGVHLVELAALADTERRTAS
jgi:hypothetical protein